jgi:peptide/nickel transport system substrate-binding protein
MRCFLLLALASLLAACGTEAPLTPTAVSGVAGNAGGAPTGPQELVVGAPTDTYVIAPPEKVTLGMYPTNTGIYETLVRLGPDYQVVPVLATSWDFVAPNTWRFTLRQGVTFHDGQKFTAQAVKATMDRIAKAGGGTPGIGPDSVKIVDDYTVEITPSRPNLRLVQQITHPNYSIIAPGSDPATKPVGTGPFTFVEYAKGDHITVARNPNYWGDKAKLDKITFRFMPDDNSRVLALKAGDVQAIYDVPREVAGEVGKTAGLKVVTSPVGAYEALYVSAHGQAPYDLGSDPAIRQALSLAINKASIVHDVWHDNAEVNSTMIPVRILGASANLVQGSSFDPAQAKQVLDKAGWTVGSDGIRSKGGRRLSLTMVVGFPTPEIHRPMPEVVQAQLKDVGIELKIVTTSDTATYDDKLTAGAGDLWAEVGNQNDANPCFLSDLLFYGKVAPGKQPGNYARLFAPGPAFDSFIEGCRAAVTQEDVAKNAAGAMHVIIDQEHIVIPIAGIFRIYAMKDTVQGFTAHPSSTNQRWDGVYLGSQ